MNSYDSETNYVLIIINNIDYRIADEHILIKIKPVNELLITMPAGVQSQFCSYNELPVTCYKVYFRGVI